MAYAAAVTITGPTYHGGRRFWVIACTETEAAAASEWSFDTGLSDGSTVTVLNYVAELASGTGTTIQPKYGTAAGLAAINTRAEFDAAAATINTSDPITFGLAAADGKVYIRSTVDADTDNTINTSITICEGQ